MDLTPELKNAIDTLSSAYSLSELSKESACISHRYRNAERLGQRLLTTEQQAVAYAVTRMPATFGALSSVLKDIQDLVGNIKTVTDVGSGTGAAAWAADTVLAVDKITCLEREDCMRFIGLRLMSGTKTGDKTSWMSFDLADLKIPPSSDMVIAGYVLNELSSSIQRQVILNLWESAQSVLVIVEPGTPAGYRNILLARDTLISAGGYIWAPCPHQSLCPLEQNDWCHFACRVARTKQHRLSKGGVAPYEDEKFSFLVVGRYPSDKSYARVLRHPLIRSGCVGLTLCSAEGVQNTVISRRDKKKFQSAKKAVWGGRFGQ